MTVKISLNHYKVRDHCSSNQNAMTQNGHGIEEFCSTNHIAREPSHPIRMLGQGTVTARHIRIVTFSQSYKLW
jgi:hypothetical protein